MAYIIFVYVLHIQKLNHMNTNIYDPIVTKTIHDIQNAFRSGSTKNISVNGEGKQIKYPFPSPTDWRSGWIYFLMVDRFNNPDANPNSLTSKPPVGWNECYGFRQGGKFNGIVSQLDYLAGLGVGAIWITPVLKNSMPARWEYNYHGYGIQDFLSVDERFASDGTSVTAEKELISMIEAAHARGMYVIFDIVINHTAQVFDYILNGVPNPDFTNSGIMNSPLGSEPDIEWLNGLGNGRPDWLNTLPDPAALSPDDAVWPSDLQRDDFFRRKGNRLSDVMSPDEKFIRGDFDTMRQLVMEYQAISANQQDIRIKYGQFPVLSILIMSYWYVIAKFDIDGFRIDTVKYVDPDKVEQFGNAMREFALSIGKRNFFTFGEIYDGENAIENFIGRNTTDGFGIDSALDFPLFNALPGFAKSMVSVEVVRKIFLDRKKAEQNKLSSHGEAGKYFVSFLDNHDQHQRFNHPDANPNQITLGLAVLFCLQGIPCVYYGTEQGLQGTVLANGDADLNSPESVREALWGKTATAFDAGNLFYNAIRQIGQLRNQETALQYGRLYFRELSSDKKGFGLSYGTGAVLAFSRILAGREIIITANSHTNEPFKGFVLADLDTNRSMPLMKVAYSNTGTAGQGNMELINNVNFYDHDVFTGTGNIAALYIELGPMEVQIIVPVISMDLV
jgi:glycosidase